MRRFSFTWSLAAEAIRLATFTAKEPWLLIGLLAASTVPALHRAGEPRPADAASTCCTWRCSSACWCWAGSAVEIAGARRAPDAVGEHRLLLLAILVRCGTVPAHCWVTDWFEHASFGIALLFVLPAERRLRRRPARPADRAGLGPAVASAIASLITAVYAAGMAVVQREVRRFFAHLFLSHASLVLVGLELNTDLSLTASLCLWFSVILSLAGFGLTLRALEARFGRLSLTELPRPLRALADAGRLLPADGTGERRASRARSASSRPSCWSTAPSRSTRTSGSACCRGGTQRDRRGAGLSPAVHRAPGTSRRSGSGSARASGSRC